MTTRNNNKPRIAIYGVGQYGQYMARFAVQKGWPIVAAYNRAGPKISQDLGRVVGLGRDIGVITQDCDNTTYDNLDADIGLTLEQFERSGMRNSPLCISYKTIPEHVLAALGYTITKTRAYVEPVIFDEPLESALMGRTIPAGDCVGSRLIGEIETKEGVTARAEIDLRLFKEGEIEQMFWEVNGKPRTRVRVERDDSAYATASNLFNRIPDVIAAPPGIVPVSKLGPLKHTALV